MLHVRILLSVFICFSEFAFSECSDLNQTECVTYSDYCSWNSEQNICEEIGGGGGDFNYGPYEVATFVQNDGMQESVLYADVTIYYPSDFDDVNWNVGSVILGAGWGGDQQSMSDWANYFSSYGFVSATIQYNDPNNDSHGYRAEAILDLIQSIKLENERITSPLFTHLDTNSFAVAGYSLSGGAVQLSAVIDSSLSAVIALNPTIIVEDCDACAGSEYCICLIPEFLDHTVPTLIIAGQNEVDELPAYDGLLGGNHYDNTPETTIKMLYEIAGGGHGSAGSPQATGGQPAKLALHWLNYFVQNNVEYCDSLVISPENASQFLTTLECNQGPPPPPPLQNIGYLRETEASFCMDDCGMYHLETEDGQFLYNVANQNNISNFEYFVNRFVEIEGDTIQCVECSAININSIFLSNQCQQPVSCFVDPCTVSNCSSSDSAECSANYCGGCYADYYQEDELINCAIPGSVNDLSGVDFGLCDMALGFAWVNNHCGMVSGCGYIVDDVNYSNQFYSSLFDCISASTLKNENEINPSAFRLYQNHPNPFNPSTQIRYQLSISSHVKIAVYNTLGEIVKTLANEFQTQGFRSVQWEGKNNNKQKVASGVYFYSIQSGEFSSTKKMILLD